MSISILRAALFVLLFGASAEALAAAAPTATTVAASGITTSSAVLNGTGTPNGEATRGWFRYSTTSPGTCNDMFGTRVPAASGTDLGTGGSAVPYSITTTGLTPGSTYYFCAIVSNATGTGYGSVLSFTIPSMPVVVTTGSTSVTSTSATLQATANPVAASTTGWFRYSTTKPATCDDAFGSRAPSSGSASLGTGITPVAYQFGISGLSPGSTYYYCAIAVNTYGTGFGAVLSFTTPATAPTVTTNGATNLTKTAGTLTGYANPGGDAATGWFRYHTMSPGTCNDTFGTRTPTMGGTSLGAGTSSVNYQQNVTGLSPGVTYYYCAIAANAMGTAWGSVQTFVTPSAPTATTSAISSLTNTSATLNGYGNPNRAPSNGWFRYALTNPGTCDDKFGSRAPVTGSSYLGADVYDYAYSQAISGLSPASTYYYCAIVQSTEGTAFGTIQSFTTSAAPTATTAAATSISATSATLNGAGNPQGGSAQAWFRYGTSDPGTCSDGFGTRVPTSSYANLGAGSSSVPYSFGIGSLSPGTTYYFCAIVTNSYGTGVGSVLSFTTPSMAPTVYTNGATNLTKTTGTLTGYGNPGGDATTGWFRYSTVSPGTCNDTFGTRAPAMAGSNLGSGSGNVNFQQNITGLSPNTTYYFCALASNASGMVLGSMQTFVTPSAPTVVTVAASSTTTNTAQLNGTGNPNRSATTGWFRYSSTAPMACDDKFGSRAPVTGGSYLGADIYDQSFSQAISGLSSGVTYYYCAIVQSSEGVAYGALMSFTTSGISTATTSAATSVSATSATLNGAGNPNGGTAQGWFRYSTTSPGTCNDGFGSRAPTSSYANLGAGTTNVPYSFGIGSLTPGTTYYYCAIVSNSYGTGYGAVMSFTTQTTAPTVYTNGATNLTRTSGILTGYANPGGDATIAWFRYSNLSPGTCNDTFGTRAPAAAGTALGAGSANVNFQQAVTGLSPNTTYYYCALASNAMGTVWGAVQSFVTPSVPTAVTLPATSPTTSSGTLNGTGNPNRAAATGWFRYSTTAPMACDDKFGSRAPVTGGSYLGADIYDYGYSQPISGLSSGTTYYYCAIVQSSEGTAYGAVLSFTTSGISTATTSAATSVSATSATLNGAGNPNGGTAQGWFRYSTTDPGTCNDGFGSRAPTSSYANLGAGTTNVPYSFGIGSLSPGTTYYFCAIVSNSYGTGYGAVMSFTTPPQAPTVYTNGATNLTRTSGVLTGYGNPGGDATTGWFRYSLSSPGTCNDTFGTRAPAMTGGSNLGAGASNVNFQQAITGLTPNTTYYYCALVANGVGSAVGSVQTFITPSVPTAMTTAATNLTNSSATLNGSGNPNRASLTGWFRYSLTNPMTCDDKFGSRAPVTGGSYLGADVYDYPYSQSISGLSSGTTYYYCAIVQSSEGVAYGAIQSFTTSAPATAATAAATSITSTSATLTGSGNPNGGSAQGWFRYATSDPGTCNDGFGSRAPTSSYANLGAGSSSVPYSFGIGSLTPGVTYYYCAIVSNTYGTGYGAVMSFTTPSNPPSVTTNGATNLTRTTGTLTGYANPGGDASTGWFRYSASSPGTCNDTFGTRAPAMGGTSLGAGASSVNFQQNITGLSPATTYYYCTIASNANGTAWGSAQAFITPMAPTAMTTSATSVTNNTATLNGSGNPNRGSTTGWFRYALTNPGTCDDKFGSRAPVTGGSYLGTDVFDQPYSQPITGLSPATQYFYCAIVSSTEGTAFGAVLTFTTSAPATATTLAATSTTSTTATLNGSGNPNGGTATAWFRYSTTNPGTCNDAFGSRAPTSSGTSLGAGTTAVAFLQPLTGLSPGVTYYFCAIASNTYGTGYGTVMSFTTPASPPTVSTDYTSGGATPTLNGSANPNGAATTGWFRIATTSPGTCNDTFGTRLPAAAGTSLGAGASFVSYSNSATGLTPGTTYYYCAIASNALGTSFGVVRSFTAPMPPTVSTLAATPVTATTATLNGSGNPNGNSTIAWFRYSTSSPGTCNDVFGTRAPSGGGTSLGSGTSATPFAEALSGLAPATTYYFCAISSSAYGTALGSVLSFTTPPATSIKKEDPSGRNVPVESSVVTVAASAVAADSATLNGTAVPNGKETTGWFRYDTTDPGTCNDAFGTRAPTKEGVALGAGAKAVDFAQTLTGLELGKTYYYCAIAGSEAKVGFGAVLSLTTKPVAPSVTTMAPSDVVIDSAVLSGSVVPNGDAATAWFRYATTKPESCTESFGTRVPESAGQELGAGVAAVTYSMALSGLREGTTYYYCAISSNALGTTYGEVLSFTPGERAPIVVTETATAVERTSATISGTVDKNGSTVSVWFRYGESDPGTCDDFFGSRATANEPAPAPQGSTAEPQGPAAIENALVAVLSAKPYSAQLDGLKPNFTYYYCISASNLGGTKFGKVRTFTTQGHALKVSSAPTDDVNQLTTSDGSVAPSIGCSYSAGKDGNRSLLALVALLPLAGLVLRRRRRLV